MRTLLLFAIACTSGPTITVQAPAGDGAVARPDTGAGGDSGDTGDSAPPDDSGDTGTEPAVVGRRGTLTLGVDGEYPAERRHRSWPAAGDLDGDGLSEVAVAVDDAAAPFRLLQLDLDAGTSTTWTFTGSSPGLEVAVGGGQLFLRSEKGDVAVFSGLPSALTVDVSAAPTSLGFAPDAVLDLGDLDGDGLGDLGFALDEALLLFRGPLPPGRLVETDAWAALTGMPAPPHVAAGDVDGDGHRDLVDPWTDSVLYGPLSPGSAGWEPAGAAPLTMEWPYADASVTGVADLDQDGQDEVLLWSEDTLLGAVPGAARDAPWTPTPRIACTAALPSEAVRVVDPDGDGHLGLAMTVAANAVAVWNDLPTGLSDCAQADLWWEEEGRNGVDGLLAVGLGGTGTDLLVVNDSDDDRLEIARGSGPDGDDVDRDGYLTPEDCADTDAAAHPYATERNNAADDDCDGAVDEHEGTPDPVPAATLVGDVGNELGLGLAAWDDDGDGVDSLVVAGESSEGACFWVASPGAAFAEATATRCGIGDDHAVATLGDVDGDGRADLAVSTDAGVRLLTAALTGTGLAAEDPGARTIVVPHDTVTDAGGTPAPAGDVDGDGLADFAVGGGGASELGDWGTSTVLMYSGDAGPGDLEPSGRYGSPEGIVYGFRRSAAVGDVDGDGLDDLAFTTGRDALVFTAVTPGDWSWDDASVVIELGDWRMAGVDPDGDRVADLVVAQSGTLGTLRRYPGPLAPGTYVHSDAAASITTGERNCDFGLEIAVIPGPTDLLAVAAPRSDGGGRDGGRVWLFDAAWSGDVTPDAALTGWDGPVGSQAGTSLAVLPAAGGASLGIGAPGAGVSGREGAVYEVEPP